MAILLWAHDDVFLLVLNIKKQKGVTSTHVVPGQSWHDWRQSDSVVKQSGRGAHGSCRQRLEVRAPHPWMQHGLPGARAPGGVPLKHAKHPVFTSKMHIIMHEQVTQF